MTALVIGYAKAKDAVALEAELVRPVYPGSNLYFVLFPGETVTRVRTVVRML